ncbi:MAG: hypothetical protein BBJ57_12660 [Desulfobacterales bacterium PC51MH44]|nr:MAG: hypothetical protein BBJ57_12660 [Desulfobacterales bacterium PC51MH44]
MNPIEPERVLPVYGGHVSHMCSHFVALNILVRSYGPSRPFIQRRPIWVISGRNKTNNAGEDTVHINTYLDFPICDDVTDLAHLSPAIIGARPEFVASPESDEPVVLTSALEAAEQEYPPGHLDLLNGSIIPRQRVDYDIRFKVRSWALDGKPAAETTFSWICIADAALRCEPMM